MPRGIAGQGNGSGQGKGMGMGRGGGRGRMGGNRQGADPEGNCVCPNCGTKVPHQPRNPCYDQICSKCGTKMVRE